MWQCWRSIAKNANVSWLLNFRIRMFMKSAVKTVMLMPPWQDSSRQTKQKPKNRWRWNKKEATQWTSSFSFILAIWISGDCCSFKILLKIHASVGKSTDLMMTAFVIREAKTKQIPMSTFACCLFCTRPINTWQDIPSPWEHPGGRLKLSPRFIKKFIYVQHKIGQGQDLVSRTSWKRNHWDVNASIRVNIFTGIYLRKRLSPAICLMATFCLIPDQYGRETLFF